VFVKLEGQNPSGSYKDRMALAMVEAAEKGHTWNDRKLDPGGTVCEASSGNTAIALAFICAVKDFQAKLCTYAPMLESDNVRLKIVRAFGAWIDACGDPADFLSSQRLKELSPNLKDHLAWIIAAKREMFELEKNSKNTVWLDQIYNWHHVLGQKSIGYEIFDQLEGQIHAWGCAIGSGANLLGVSLALAERGVSPITFGIVPENSELSPPSGQRKAKKGKIQFTQESKQLAEEMGLDKWETETSILEKMLEAGYPDELFQVNDHEAREMANQLCQKEGIYCGISSGANVLVALEIAKRLKPEENVVTVICDRRDRYLGDYPEDPFVV
jgi:cysteine synthase A